MLGEARLRYDIRTSSAPYPSCDTRPRSWPVMRIRCLVFALVLAFFCTLNRPSSAIAQAGQRTYEEIRTSLVLRELGRTPDPLPEGKRISFVQVRAEDVFVAGEPWPNWLNIFHWLTQEEVIRHELLFCEGEPYRDSLVQESTRNLRGLGIFSLVSITAVKTNDSSAVGVVVHTRDIWSLRLEDNFQTTGKRLDYLLLQLTEHNLLGRDKLVTGRFILKPLTFRVGEVYSDRHLWGSNLSLQESFDVIFNRHSGNAEGSRSELVFGRPYFSLSQAWSYTLAAVYLDQIWRDEQNGQILVFDIAETADREKIPRVFRDRRAIVKANVSYRHGTNYKQTFLGGFGLRLRDAEPNRETNLAPEQTDAFARDVLPRYRRDLFPYLGYQLFLPNYTIFKNLATYGQSESVRTGPFSALTFEFPVRAVGSNTNSFVASGALGYTFAYADALAETTVKPSARLENGRVIDQFVRGELRGATPPFLWGRLVWRGQWELRRSDTTNVVTTLGGDNGLRGYPSGYFREPSGNVLLANFEYRSLPLLWQSIQAGAVLFYDTGSIYQDLSRMRLCSAVGWGLRLLIPQLNQFAFRFDFGIPINEKCCTVMVNIARGQNVAMTATEDLEAPSFDARADH
jgi:hypothetical protein